VSRDEAALAQLRIDALRLRLQWQRAELADRLGATADDSGFPRSATVRWLLRHPVLVAGLLLPRGRPVAGLARIALVAGVAGVLLLGTGPKSAR
jgi:hypothetical protein